MAGTVMRNPRPVAGGTLPPGPADAGGGGGGRGDWTLLTTARNEVLAHLITGRLLQMGIETVMDASNPSPAAWLHPFGDPGSPVRIFVRQGDLAAASLLLHDADQGEVDLSQPESSGPSGRRGSPTPWWRAGLHELFSVGWPRVVLRLVMAVVATGALGLLLVLGPCASHWFCV